MEDLFPNHEKIILQLIIIQEIAKEIQLELNNHKNLSTNLNNNLYVAAFQQILSAPFPAPQSFHDLIRAYFQSGRLGLLVKGDLREDFVFCTGLDVQQKVREELPGLVLYVVGYIQFRESRFHQVHEQLLSVHSAVNQIYVDYQENSNNKIRLLQQ